MSGSGITIKNFMPVGETIPLNATSTSSYATFQSNVSSSQPDVLITNAGANVAFVGFGLASKGVTAYLPSTSGAFNATPVQPGNSMVFAKSQTQPNADTCAAITGTGTTQLYFTAGVGS